MLPQCQKGASAYVCAQALQPIGTTEANILVHHTQNYAKNKSINLPDLQYREAYFCLKDSTYHYTRIKELKSQIRHISYIAKPL